MRHDNNEPSFSCKAGHLSYHSQLVLEKGQCVRRYNRVESFFRLKILEPSPVYLNIVTAQEPPKQPLKHYRIRLDTSTPVRQLRHFRQEIALSSAYVQNCGGAIGVQYFDQPLGQKSLFIRILVKTSIVSTDIIVSNSLR